MVLQIYAKNQQNPKFIPVRNAPLKKTEVKSDILSLMILET